MDYTLLEKFFGEENIRYFAPLAAESLIVTDRERYDRMEREIGRVQSAVIFLIPYFSGQTTTNLSVYAQPRDYHGYVRLLAKRLAAVLEQEGRKEQFCICADTSPIAERDAALRSGLGFLGKNGLVLHPLYGSYFFIGEIFFASPLPCVAPSEIRACLGCDACVKACPTGAIADPERKRCLSLLSQKKELSPEEEALMRKATCKWGCDLCQTVCPYNQKAQHTTIPYFLEEIVTDLDESAVEAPKKEFLTRAYSWRGRTILRRNLGWEEKK